MDLPKKFWKEYIQLNELERGKKIEFIIKSIDNYYSIKMDKKLRTYALTQLIKSYFDDLIWVLKEKNEKNK